MATRTAKKNKKFRWTTKTVPLIITFFLLALIKFIYAKPIIIIIILEDWI